MAVDLEILEIDGLFRSGMASKEIAETLGVSQTGIYPTLASRGLMVAEFKFLVDSRTGKPLQPVKPSEINATGARALNKRPWIRVPNDKKPQRT